MASKIVKKLQDTAIRVGSGIQPPKRSPDLEYGELFREAQMRQVHPDGKALVDAIPVTQRRKLLKAYEQAKKQPGFDILSFINQHYPTLAAPKRRVNGHRERSIETHITKLWNELERDALKNSGSLLALPYPYIVPGGRFEEQFYWDTYFMMLGLDATGRWDLISNMMKNYRYMIMKIGYVPTANRTYLLSRSQPPFYSHMVRIVANKYGKRVYIKALPYLLKEYNFWMSGGYRLFRPYQAHRRVLKMPNGTLLNRYYDDTATARPESYREDTETAMLARERDDKQVYRDLRAGAESGWDFTSRWLDDGKSLETIRTTEIIPVDLNCLMYDLEMTIAKAYDAILQPLLARRYSHRAGRRAAVIIDSMWDEQTGFFHDLDKTKKGEPTPVMSLAGVFPLYSGIATKEQAERVADILKTKFLQEGGLLTSLKNTGQQWDSPNGWAPLQWVAIRGLRRYGHDKLADEIKRRWIATNMHTYQAQHKLVEKYDVTEPTKPGGGGEYPLQDGFGWTNGVLISLLRNTDMNYIADD